MKFIIDFSLPKLPQSRKYRWFISLQLGITIFMMTISAYMWYYYSEVFPWVDVYSHLLKKWVEFTWVNVLMYFGANVGTSLTSKLNNLGVLESQQYLEQKNDSRKYKWFKNLQLFVTVVSLLAISKLLYYNHITNFESFDEIFNIWEQFTWGIVFIYFGANVVEKMKKPDNY